MDSSIVEDMRTYECRVLKWEPALRCDFLYGDPLPPPLGVEYVNIRTLLKEHYCHLSSMHLNNKREAHINTAAYDFFNIPSSLLEEATNYILSILNVPEENKKSIAQQILHYAHDNVPNHEDTNTLYMIVVVNVDISYHNCDRAIEKSMKDQTCKLKGVKLQEKKEGLSDKCSVCWEDFGDDVVQMPCSHFFHGNCILNWLLKTNNCPLCRFKMPSSHDSSNESDIETDSWSYGNFSNDSDIETDSSSYGNFSNESDIETDSLSDDDSSSDGS